MNTELDLIKLTTRTSLDGIFASDVDVEIIQHTLQEMSELYISGRIYGEVHFQEYHFQYPADWWEAFKERFAPPWFTFRWPIRYTHHHVSIDVLYPELSRRIKLPNEFHRMILSGFSEVDTKE